MKNKCYILPYPYLDFIMIYTIVANNKIGRIKCTMSFSFMPVHLSLCSISYLHLGLIFFLSSFWYPIVFIQFLSLFAFPYLLFLFSLLPLYSSPLLSFHSISYLFISLLPAGATEDTHQTRLSSRKPKDLQKQSRRMAKREWTSNSTTQLVMTPLSNSLAGGMRSGLSRRLRRRRSWMGTWQRRR